MSTVFCDDQEIGHFSLDVSQKLIENLTSPIKLKSEEFEESPAFSKPFVLMKSHSEIAYRNNVLEDFTQEFKTFNNFSCWENEDEKNYNSNRLQGLTLIYECFAEGKLEVIEEMQMFYAEKREIFESEPKFAYIHSVNYGDSCDKNDENSENLHFNQQIIEIFEEILANVCKNVSASLNENVDNINEKENLQQNSELFDKDNRNFGEGFELDQNHEENNVKNEEKIESFTTLNSKNKQETTENKLNTENHPDNQENNENEEKLKENLVDSLESPLNTIDKEITIKINEDPLKLFTETRETSSQNLANTSETNENLMIPALSEQKSTFSEQISVKEPENIKFFTNPRENAINFEEEKKESSEMTEDNIAEFQENPDFYGRSESNSPEIPHRKESIEESLEDFHSTKAKFFEKLETIENIIEENCEKGKENKEEECDFNENFIEESSENQSIETREFVFENKLNTLNMKPCHSNQENSSFSEKEKPGPNIQSEIFYKEGYLYKKGRNFLSGWQKRWFMLKDFKLIYYKDQEKKNERGFINFKLLETLIDFTSDNLIMTIKYANSQKKMHLKASTKEKSKEWIILLGNALKTAQKFPKLNVEKEFIDSYWRNDVIGEEELCSIADTGDILLFRTSNLPAKLQRSVTGSKFDHVGLLIKIGGIIHILDAQYENGVSLSEWCEFIEENDLYSKVVLRRLNFPNKEALADRVSESMQKVIGQKYKLTAGKLLQRKSKYVSSKHKNSDPKSFVRTEKHDGFFCSELVASIYKHIGLLDPKIPSTQYWPGSFSSEKSLKLIQGGSLSHEIAVVLNRHLK